MGDHISYIAYEGDLFIIEWYFDACRKSQALSYYQSLNDNERIKVLQLFKRMGDAGKINDKTKFMIEGKYYA